jgi:biopolymer transport protein ExbB/TolQ
MDIFTIFQSGDIVLITIFTSMILISIYNWYIALFKMYILHKNKKPDANLIEQLNCSKDILGLEMAYKHMESILQSKKSNLEKRISFLATAASTTPFIGLLGTVWGIVKSLREISAAGSATLATISGPMGEALISTAVALFVAIPASVFYNLLISKIEDIIDSDRSFIEEQILRYFKK